MEISKKAAAPTMAALSPESLELGKKTGREEPNLERAEERRMELAETPPAMTRE